MYKVVEKINNAEDMNKCTLLAVAPTHFIKGELINCEPIQISEIEDKETFFLFNNMTSKIYSISEV